MKADLVTIKVLRSTMQDIGIVSSVTREKNYEMIDRVMKKESEKIVKTLSERGKKLIK